jgi:hypothetical protein
MIHSYLIFFFYANAGQQGSSRRLMYGGKSNFEYVVYGHDHAPSVE